MIGGVAGFKLFLYAFGGCYFLPVLTDGIKSK